MILIITSKLDSHIGAVTCHLDAAGVDWIRINVEDAAQNLEVDLDPPRSLGVVRVRDSGREFLLSEVRAVWYRKPEPVKFEHLELDGGALDYVEAEFREILDGFYAMLQDVPWINNPFGTRLAHRKMFQLKVASSLGLAVPRTRVTNNVVTALSFAERMGGEVAIKSLGALSVVESHDGGAYQYGIFTRRAARTELEAVVHSIPVLPTTFQEFVPKEYEMRINVIGAEVYATRIDARRDDATADDYRFDTRNLVHAAVDCPSELADLLRRYLAYFELEFGAFDLIVRPSGEVVFLECNPNGQWLWVEQLTKQQIGRAIAHRLLHLAGCGAQVGAA